IADTTSLTWSNAAPMGPVPPGSPDLGACYDKKRDRIYVGRGAYADPLMPGEGSLYIYDVATNAWSNPSDPPNPEGWPLGFPAANGGMVHYDVVNDRVVIFYHWDGMGAVLVLDPATNTYSLSTPVPPDAAAGQVWHGFYSEELNAHFVFVAGDSEDNGT